jgi:hypothetical protein
MMATGKANTSAKTTVNTEENSEMSVVPVVVVAELTIVTLCEYPDLGAMVTGGPDFGLAMDGAQAYVPGVEGLMKKPLPISKPPLQPWFTLEYGPENDTSIFPWLVMVGWVMIISPIVMPPADIENRPGVVVVFTGPSPDPI